MRRWAETGDAYGMWILAIVLWDQVAWEHGEHFVYEDLAEQKKRIVVEAYNLASQCLPGWRKFADLATERFGERRSLQRAMAHVLDISYGVEVDCSAIPEEAKRVSCDPACRLPPRCSQSARSPSAVLAVTFSHRANSRPGEFRTLPM